VIFREKMTPVDRKTFKKLMDSKQSHKLKGEGVKGIRARVGQVNFGTSVFGKL